MEDYWGLWFSRGLLRSERLYNKWELSDGIFSSLEEKKCSIIVRGLVVCNIQGK